MIYTAPKSLKKSVNTTSLTYTLYNKFLGG